MEITEVRIKLMEEASERLQAFCSITFDNSFVVRDLKIIEGANGPFVAMPSRKLTAHCPQCGCKNHLRAAHCNQCGGRLADERTGQGRGRPRQALRRHRAPDQLGLPRDDPGARDPRVSSRSSTARSCRATSRPTTTTTTKTPSRRRVAGKDPAAVRDKTQVQPAEQQPRSPHTAAAHQRRPSRRQRTRPSSRQQGSSATDLARAFSRSNSSRLEKRQSRARDCAGRRSAVLTAPSCRSCRSACDSRRSVANVSAFDGYGWPRPLARVLPKTNALRLHIIGRGVWLRSLPFAPRCARHVSRPERE